MSASFNTSGCWCCRDCPSHKINQRQHYVIPCDKRKDCPTFQKYLQDNRFGNYQRTKQVQELPTHFFRKKRFH